MRKLLTVFLTGFSLCASSAMAGEWYCENGIDDASIMTTKIAGDAQANFADFAEVAMVKEGGLPYFKYALTQEEPRGDELARATIGADHPMSTFQFKIFKGEVSPGKYRSAMRLVNFPIPKDLDGFCQFNP